MTEFLASLPKFRGAGSGDTIGVRSEQRELWQYLETEEVICWKSDADDHPNDLPLSCYALAVVQDDGMIFYDSLALQDLPEPTKA